MTKKTIGWGLIGTGRIAEDRMLPGINAFKQNKLIGVVSRDPARAQDFAKRFGAQHAYTNFDDLLRNPDVDAVAIHTPNSLHCEEVLAAARAGKHVFCDKPMATTVADAERMVAACEKAGVTLGMNFHNRSMPGFIEAKRVVGSGEIGEVTVVELEASPGYRPGGTLSNWRVDPVMSGLGTTMSIGVHVYDILRYILSAEVEMVSSFFDTPRNVMEQTNMSTLRFTNGAIALVNVNEKSPLPYNDFVIHGTKGRITGKGLTRSRAGGVFEVATTDGKTRSQEFPAINAHAACIGAFSQALLDGKPFSPSGIDGLRSMQLTEAMAKSAWDGVHVRLAS